MAITTLDGAIAGMQPPVPFMKVGGTMPAAGTRYSLFLPTGTPGSSPVPGSGLNGTALTSYGGQLTFNNPGSGNTYLARLSANTGATGTLILYDRLWHNSGIIINTTTAQGITFPTLPARDATGTTNGAQVQVGLEVYTSLGNGAVTNTTISYTNSAGTAGQTGTISSFPASAVSGTVIPFQLAAGDVGVRSIASITLGTSYVSGSMGLVAFRELARVDVMIANVGNAIDALTSGFVQMYNSTVPFLMWIPTATGATNFSGQFIVSQG